MLMLCFQNEKQQTFTCLLAIRQVVQYLFIAYLDVIERNYFNACTFFWGGNGLVKNVINVCLMDLPESMDRTKTKSVEFDAL